MAPVYASMHCITEDGEIQRKALNDNMLLLRYEILNDDVSECTQHQRRT